MLQNFTLPSPPLMALLTHCNTTIPMTQDSHPYQLPELPRQSLRRLSIYDKREPGILVQHPIPKMFFKGIKTFNNEKIGF